MREHPISLSGGGDGDSGIDIQVNFNTFIKDNRRESLTLGLHFKTVTI